MKSWLTIGVLLALIADVALFAGIGFGTGALAIASPTTPNVSTTPAYLTSSIEFQVVMTTVSQSGLPFITSMVGTGTSTSLTFGVNIWDPSWNGKTDNCGNAGSPVFAPASTDANTASYTITFGGTAWTGSVDGAQVQASPSGQLTVSADNQGGSTFAGWCLGPTYSNNGGDVVSPTLFSSSPLYYSHTLTISGVFNPQTLTISFSAQGTHCSGSNPVYPGQNNACSYVGGLSPQGDDIGSPNGVITGTATTTTQTQSAYSYVINTNPGQLAYNGGTLTAQVWTGYDQVSPGQSGYNLIVDYPQARPSGGSPDGAFRQIAVNQLCYGCSVSWPIPAGTAVNSTVPGFNEFIIVLQASLYFTGSATANIDIYPNSAPGEPSITMSNTGSYAGPQVGATETITAVTSPSAHSGNVSSINFIVYYVPANGVSSAVPSCSYFVTGITCPQGSFITGSLSSTTMTSTFSFLVSPPPGVQQVCVQAFAESTTQQASQTGIACVTIVASNCVPGASGCSVAPGLWTFIGPILFAAAFVLASILAMLYVPLGTVYRVAVPVVVAGVFVALYVFGILGGLFIPGGVL